MTVIKTVKREKEHTEVYLNTIQVQLLQNNTCVCSKDRRHIDAITIYLERFN